MGFTVLITISLHPIICYWVNFSPRHTYVLASSPGLFFSLNDNENNERNGHGRTDKRMRKIGLVSIAGVVVRMRQPLPRFWVIIYVYKLLGFSSIFSVYSRILIHVSAFKEAAPWLFNRCMAFRTLTQSSLLKLRQKENLMHLYKGVCSVLAALLFILIRLQCWSTQVLQLNGLLCWWFHPCVPDQGWPGRWATEAINSTTTTLL